MTLEEKIAHLQATSMEEARAQGNEIIDSYRDALEKVLQDHKVEAQRQSEIRIKTETINAKQQINQSLAKAQLDLNVSRAKSSKIRKIRFLKRLWSLSMII